MDAYLLYVEDDPLNREVMQIIIEMGLGFDADQLVMFDDSRDLLERIAALARRPTLIMLDINVKPHNGFAMLELIRADKHLNRVPVIALTAHNLADEIDALRAHGFDGAIAKPLSIQTFPNLLLRAINGESVWSFE